MKTLKVRLAYQAPMTGIPSAQMIFGAICHGLKAVHGQKTLESFLNSIEENPQTFAISSLFLANTLPLPLDIEPARIDDLELDRDALTTIKKLKKVRFISQPLFDLYKQDRDQFNRTFLSNWVKGTYLFNEKHMLLHGKDEHEYFSSVVVKKHVATRNKWAFKDDDKALFYTSRLVYSKGTVFEFYIYGDDENLRLIQKVFERLIYFTLGWLSNILKWITKTHFNPFMLPLTMIRQYLDIFNVRHIFCEMIQGFEAYFIIINRWN